VATAIQNNKGLIMTGGHLAALNTQQRKAVLHGRKHTKMIHRPLLVIAGAGSGKTTVVAARVAELLLRGVDSKRIMLLTFTNRAAQEVTDRIKEMAGATLGRRGLRWAGTFHSVGVRLLRKYGREIGLLPTFTILDRSDAEWLMGKTREELGLCANKPPFPAKDECLSIYSTWVNSASSLKRVLKKRFHSCRRWQIELTQLFKTYDAAKRAQNVVDFDDMVGLWWKLLKETRRGREIGALFDHVLVDEYQDTNRLQAKLLLALKKDGRGVTVVGDDAQSIYSFRAATVRNILAFPGHFVPKAKVVTLERNYRSTQPILRASNAVIDMAERGYTKRLFSKRDSKKKPLLCKVTDAVTQARYVANRIVAAREGGTPLNDQAVLFRVAADSAQLEIELAIRNIPFEKWGGIKFLDSAHIKDALSVLRWCQNSGDMTAALRVLQLLPGIGAKTAMALFKGIAGSKLSEDLSSALSLKATPKGWPTFMQTLKAISEKHEPWPSELQTLCDWLSPQFRHLYKDYKERIEDLKQLKQIAGTFRSRKEFLTAVSLNPDCTLVTPADGGGPEGRVILSTIHSAKGHEWHSVTLLNAVEGCIPFRKAIRTRDAVEEERRLLYVAMTRSKDELTIIVPEFHYTHSNLFQGMRARQTRFIPSKLSRYFECCNVGENDPNQP
jgi:DNA helicase II / ATP-dependent DNA helicase PcrA